MTMPAQPMRPFVSCGLRDYAGHADAVFVIMPAKPMLSLRQCFAQAKCFPTGNADNVDASLKRNASPQEMPTMSMLRQSEMMPTLSMLRSSEMLPRRKCRRELMLSQYNASQKRNDSKQLMSSINTFT